MSYPDWAAVVALKPATIGKSRLAALPGPLRHRLAAMMALDTLAALASATSRLVVVSDSTTVDRRLQRAGIDAVVITDPEPGGLNNALRAGEAVLRADRQRAVLACVGDLPTLTPGAVRAVIDAMTLAANQQHRRGFVADLAGTGSTMLLADRVGLDPRFGPGSAAAHRSSGAADLAALRTATPLPDRCVGDEFLRARTDVDAPKDLPGAIRVGVGPHTASLIADGRLADYAELTITRLPVGGRHRYKAISTSGQEFSIAADAIETDVSLSVGQRLHAAVRGDLPVSAWLNR